MINVVIIISSQLALDRLSSSVGRNVAEHHEWPQAPTTCPSEVAPDLACVKWDQAVVTPKLQSTSLPKKTSAINVLKVRARSESPVT
jgi:hypothetical protein